MSAVAASGALLIIAAFSKYSHINRDEIERLFTGWTLLTADPVPGQQYAQYITGPALLRVALRRDLFRPWRYQLRHQRTG